MDNYDLPRLATSRYFPPFLPALHSPTLHPSHRRMSHQQRPTKLSLSDSLLPLSLTQTRSSLQLSTNFQSHALFPTFPAPTHRFKRCQDEANSMPHGWRSKNFANRSTLSDAPMSRRDDKRAEQTDLMMRTVAKTHDESFLERVTDGTLPAVIFWRTDTPR